MACNVLDPNSRFEKSLGLLTTRFVNLLQEAEDGVLDLKVAADTLNVRQKRRIYDITNVLEGIGLIEKKNKNCIKWKGAVAGENTQEASERLYVLQDEIQRLDQHEKMLDQHKAWAQQNIKNILEDISNYQQAYATHEDICRCFNGDTLLAIQAPSGTQLEVPIPETLAGQKKRYQIHLKSDEGQIYVLLVNKDADSDPIVVQVPPPKEIADAIRKETLDDSISTSSRDRLVTSSQFLVDIKEETVGTVPTGIKRERENFVIESVSKRSKFGEVPETDGDDLEESSSEIDTSVEGGSGDGQKSVLPRDFAMPSVESEIPGLEELMSSEMFGPLLRLSPPPSEKDYCFNLDDSEGVCDLFDVL